MTPEDAIPDSIEIAILTNQESIDKGQPPLLFFTAKETAEIAKAYGYAVAHSFDPEHDEAVRKFERLFEEWSK